MFKIIGALVVYGFAIYGVSKALEDAPATSEADKLRAPVTPLKIAK